MDFRCRYAGLLTYAEAKIMLNQIDELTKKCINDVQKKGRSGYELLMSPFRNIIPIPSNSGLI